MDIPGRIRRQSAVPTSSYLVAHVNTLVDHRAKPDEEARLMYVSEPRCRGKTERAVPGRLIR